MPTLARRKEGSSLDAAPRPASQGVRSTCGNSPSHPGPCTQGPSSRPHQQREGIPHYQNGGGGRSEAATKNGDTLGKTLGELAEGTLNPNSRSPGGGVWPGTCLWFWPTHASSFQRQFQPQASHRSRGRKRTHLPTPHLPLSLVEWGAAPSVPEAPRGGAALGPLAPAHASLPAMAPVSPSPSLSGAIDHKSCLSTWNSLPPTSPPTSKFLASNLNIQT